MIWHHAVQTATEVNEIQATDATCWHFELPVDCSRVCWHCGEPCAFIEYSFEAPLHPGVCTDAKWGEYLQELSQSIGNDKTEQAEELIRHTGTAIWIDDLILDQLWNLARGE